VSPRRAVVLPAIVALAVALPLAAGGARSPAAVAAHVAFAFAFLPMSVLAASLRPAAVLCVAAGAWLLISPWALGYGAVAGATATDALMGIAVVAASAGLARGEGMDLR
jgi:SPW repeat